jgi:hypothetical protein
MLLATIWLPRVPTCKSGSTKLSLSPYARSIVAATDLQRIKFLQHKSDSEDVFPFAAIHPQTTKLPTQRLRYSSTRPLRRRTRLNSQVSIAKAKFNNYLDDVQEYLIAYVLTEIQATIARLEVTKIGRLASSLFLSEPLVRDEPGSGSTKPFRVSCSSRV